MLDEAERERNEAKIRRGVANDAGMDPCRAGGPAPDVPVEAICRAGQALGSRGAEAPSAAGRGAAPGTDYG